MDAYDERHWRGLWMIRSQGAHAAGALEDLGVILC
jgi:hypothetical protein